MGTGKFGVWALGLASTLLATVAASTTARADDWYSSDDPPVYESGMLDYDGNVVRRPDYYDPAGASLQVGGGVTSFTDSESLGVSGVGGTWDARLVLGVRSPIGLELGYVGSAFDITGLGLDDSAMLIGQGAEAALRINIPVVNGETVVAPFFFGGIGWTHYDVVNTAFRTSNVARQDDVMTWPVGGGISFAYRHFLFDTRFTYRFSESNQLMRSAEGRELPLNSWTGSAHIGYLF